MLEQAFIEPAHGIVWRGQDSVLEDEVAWRAASYELRVLEDEVTARRSAAYEDRAVPHFRQ
ncbi:hypothetical protein [Streptomyces sp. PA5.6]|uniref:hypothetical protein n=1 Tax=Streptomyces sp. PA5.6 TaxID=3035651 RepID=UPI0039046E2A